MWKYCFNAFLFCSFFLILSACSTSRLPLVNYQQSVNYTIIYLIHGDANYLYHNRQGQPLQADLKALNEAKRVGRRAENGEVFIFHLKPETQIFYLFPRKDRHFLYYRNGRMVYEKSYSPHSKKSAFVTEAKLYHYFHQSVKGDSAYKKILLFFGHEIPIQTGIRYFRSRPDAEFSTALFAAGVKRFIQPKESRFDLAVLSTCDNGTPLMVHTLAPLTKYVLASPLNLHLSHIDMKALQLLERPGEINTEKLAVKTATDTYNRLSAFLQTVISLSLYNTNKMKRGLKRLANSYTAYLEKRERNLAPSAKNVDCKSLSFFKPVGMKKAVRVWYRAPQFGRKAGNKNFSGWGCKSTRGSK